jgi:Fe-S-cluster containining protein
MQATVSTPGLLHGTMHRMKTIRRAENTDPEYTVPGISCSDCKACCCRLEVMLMGEDEHVPAELTARDPWGGWVMRRLADGWCAALDRHTMRCTIYELRPTICRDYRTGGSDCIEQRAVTAAT